MNFSVLISVYYKENPQYFDEALFSISSNQTVFPTQIVIVTDGAIGSSLEMVIRKYYEQYPQVIKVVKIRENRGLGNALKTGVLECDYDYIARMDSDDISSPDRFYEQIKYLEENPHVDLVGSYISEFEDDIRNVTGIRKVPVTEKGIHNRLKTRSPINHVSTMFKRQAVISAGNYTSGEIVEDYDLWVKMVLSKKVMHNIPKTLVFVRVGDGMYSRRGNSSLIAGFQRIQRKLVENHYISFFRYIFNQILLIMFIKAPVKLKRLLYTKFLRYTP